MEEERVITTRRRKNPKISIPVSTKTEEGNREYKRLYMQEARRRKQIELEADPSKLAAEKEKQAEYQRNYRAKNSIPVLRSQISSLEVRVASLEEENSSLKKELEKYLKLYGEVS